MLLVNLSISNFRSITKAHNIPLSSKAVLISRNNEGKSNILKALTIAMKALQEHAMRGSRGITRRGSYRRDNSFYDWIRDFPVSLQNRRTGRNSIFRLDFELNETENALFRTEIKSRLNGTLPLEIRIGEDNNPVIKVAKKGPGATTLNSKSSKIADFVANRISFNHIPAVRTDKEVIDIIGEMLLIEFKALEQDEKYKESMAIIKEFQKPILLKISERIKNHLREFLPNIKDVHVDMSDDVRRSPYRNDFEVIVDDGTPTNIEFKGDGVKSLAALSLLKNRNSDTGTSIIAIEEPESHLHPAAIHQINKIVCSLAEKNQVIITTHNPLLVDRNSIKSNVIIENGKASTVKNIKQIRDLLGIKASDNLINASFSIVVEGEEDRVALSTLLPLKSPRISKAIKNDLLIIQPVHGAGNLSYKLSLINNELYVYHVLLDNDKSGRDSFEKAKKEGLLSEKHCTFTTCPGMTDSEFEDGINVNLYKDEIYSRYGVSLQNKYFKTSKKKWSDRMKDSFLKQGKSWSDAIEKEIKNVVANLIAQNPAIALNSHKCDYFEALVASIENMIQ